MYRPQLAYPPPPPGYEDETFHYSFDSTNTPLLGVNILAGAYANNIILPLQPDAPFICRGIQIRTVTGGGSTLDCQLKTPHGDYLATVPVPISRWLDGGGRASVTGKMRVPLEMEIECQAGSIWTLYLFNPTLGTVAPPSVTLFGVKRRRCNDRRAA